MKKEYKKPQIHMEHFSLSQSIAATCESVTPGGDQWGRAQHSHPSTCSWDYNGVLLWTEGAHCSIDGEVIQTICYNAPEGVYTVFGS